MKAIINATTPEELEEFRTVIVHVYHGALVYEYSYGSGAVENEVYSYPSGEAVNDILIQAGGGFIYITAKFESTEVIQTGKLLWGRWLKNSTENIGKPFYESLKVDCAYLDMADGTMYDLACENPVFITVEDDGTIMFVFREEMVFYGIEKISISDSEGYEV